jgi:hypothetical protein
MGTFKKKWLLITGKGGSDLNPNKLPLPVKM